MIDVFDASDDRLRLAVRRAVMSYGQDELFACIADADPVLRTAAARELQVRGDSSIFDHVLALADHPRHEMREISAFILGQIGPPTHPFAAASFPVLERLLRDPYWEVRRAAAGAVGTLTSASRRAPADIRSTIIGLTSDPSPDVRASVAAALGTIDDRRVDACLERLRDDVDPVVRDDAEFSIELRGSRGRPESTEPRPEAAE